MFWVKLNTAWSLGLDSLFRVFSYRLRLNYALHPVCFLKGEPPKGNFFLMSEAPTTALSSPSRWGSDTAYFGFKHKAIDDNPPQWHKNPFTNACAKSHLPWWKIPDFDIALGDIKVIWEASRFDWVLVFAQYVRNENDHYLTRLNTWLNDWCQKNPPYQGVNWKCGQEAAIRVMHLAAAALILKQVHLATKPLEELLILHLKRIAATLSYAIAQNNNHATSEAAALYIGGTWLESIGVKQGKSWGKQGRQLLEKHVSHLIEADGTFSQYSLNYHRLMLDTLSLAEIWRLHLGLPAFSVNLLKKAIAATEWLAAMVDDYSGRVPNLGANDGARILPLTETDYLDYRPSLHLATILFKGQRAYAEYGAWDEPLVWFDIASSKAVMLTHLQNHVFDEGGFAVLRRNQARVIFRYPRFRFRPIQADALHVDLWVHGENILRDGGTYSYATSERWVDYFSGTQSHNTIQFDDRSQMPKLSRFLFGQWLKTTRIDGLQEMLHETQFGAEYKDSQGVRHKRSLRLAATDLQVRDEIEGFQKKAILRWRLKEGVWEIKDNSITNGQFRLTVTGSMPIKRLALVKGYESNYYLKKTMLMVLEVEVRHPGTLITECHW